MDVLFFLMISSMMISSGKGDPFEMKEKQCSVFPGRPKCFEPIKKFGDRRKEINLHNRPETVEIINTGESVTISGIKINGASDEFGSMYQQTHLMTVTCTKDTDYNDATHGTQFWGKNGKKWENQLNAKDLVITTRREKWTCIDQGTGALLNFYRMVSEHLTKNIIGNVTFPDGTFIHKIPIPRLRHDEQQMYRGVIREIKYTDSSFVKKKYDGYFSDRLSNMAEENIGDFIELDKAEGVVTVSDSSGPDSSGKIIYKRKPSIETGEAFRNQQSRAKCYKLDMDQFKTNEVFGIFPEWSYSVNGQRFTPLEKTKFREKFIITKYQIIGCQMESQTDTFFRVEIEYLFTEDVNEVHVTNTIDNIYKFKLPGSSTETSFGIVESFDIKLENPTDAFRFAGTATIDESYTLWEDGKLHQKPSEQRKTSEPSEQDKTSKQVEPKPTNPSSTKTKPKSSVFCCFGFGKSKTAP